MCVCVCLFRASAQLPQSHQPAGAISTKQCGRSPRTWQHFKILSQGGGAQGIVVALGEKKTMGHQRGPGCPLVHLKMRNEIVLGCSYPDMIFCHEFWCAF